MALSLVGELHLLAKLVDLAGIVSPNAQVRMALCTRDGQERFPAIWHEIDLGTSLSDVVNDVLYAARERARTVTEYRFRPCGFGQATHYRHVREGAIFPMDGYHARHSGDCVLPLAVEMVNVPA